MPEQTLISLADAARLEGVPYLTLQKRFKRQRVHVRRDPDDRRRGLISTSLLSPSAYQLWLREQVAKPHATRAAGTHGAAIDLADTTHDSAITPTAPNPTASLRGARPLAQPLLPFRPGREKDDQALIAGIPKKFEAYVFKWSDLIGACSNGNWERWLGKVYNGHAINGREDFIRAKSAEYGTNVREYYRKQSLLKQILKDPAIPQGAKENEWAKRIIPRPRPGRSGAAYFNQWENAWQFHKFCEFYLNQAKLSVEDAFKYLLAEIDARERAHGIGSPPYNRPTISQCRTALKNFLSRPENIRAREGAKAFNDKCAPYISRTPPERSGQVVSTDQKYLDILCRDHAWNVGRIWTVNFVDVASERWLGGAFGPVLSGDMVMEAAAMMLERAVPEAVQFDRGKEFVGSRFAGGHFKISGERYYAESVGLWERLGVRQLVAIGRNPQTKPIERWHANLRPFEQLWPTWTGGSTFERPERLSEIESKIELFKKGKGPAPAVPTIDQVITAFLWWVENVWNARARGKGRYRRGLTPDEAWNVKAPAGGHRKLSAAEIDWYTSDHRFLKVARGGQVNLTFHGQTLEFVAPDLFNLQGETVEVIVSRRDLSQVVVVYPVPGGTAQCVATRKEELEWGEDRKTIALRLRCIATVKRLHKRATKQADAAGFLLAEAAGVPTGELVRAAQSHKLIDRRQAFGGPKPEQEVSGAAFAMQRLGRKSKTSSEIAAEFLKEDA